MSGPCGSAFFVGVEMKFSTEPFNDEEKDGIFRFLGYANWRRLAQSIQLGVPSASQPFWLVLDAVIKISPESRARIRRDLKRALDVECQIEDSNSRVRTASVGDIKMNRHELDDLLRRLEYWTIRIADGLGVEINRHSIQGAYGFGGGINSRVVS